MNPRQSESRRRHSLILLGLVISLAFFPAHAGAQRYLVHTYTEIDGLPSSLVYDIVQDQSGLMWFATRCGVACYDGSRWTHHDQDNGLDFAAIRRVLIDPKGTIWAVSDVTPVHAFWFDGSVWNQIPTAPTSERQTSIVTADFVTSTEGEVFAVGSDIGQLYLWNGDTWGEIQVPGGLSDAVLRSVEAVEGKLYIATVTGLYVLDPLRVEDGFSKISTIPEGELLGMHFDAVSNQLWLVGRDWIGRIEDGSFALEADDLVFYLAAGNFFFDTELDRRGGLYFGNLSGLFHHNRHSGLESFGINSGLISGGTSGLCLDREENLWVASPRGVTKIVSRRFASYDRRHGLLADEVTSVLERRSGEFVLGHDGGLTIWGEEKRHVVLSEHPLHAKVLDLDEDSSGTVWIAAEWYGLGSMGDSGDIRWRKGEKAFQGEVTSVLNDSRGRRWVTARQGLFRSRGDDYELVDLPKKPGLLWYLRKLFEGANGSIYVATADHGVYRIGEDGIKNWKNPNFRAANNVYALLERHDGTVWAGTRAGLFRLGERTLEKVSAPGPEIDRPVFFMLEDGENRPWFGTDSGAQRWDGESFQIFTVMDGLIGTEANRDAGLLDSKNRVWIGTNQGVSIFQEDTAERGAKPTVAFMSLTAGGTTFPLDNTLSLKHTDNTLEFRFRAISFVDEKRVVFRSWLDGFEDDWRGPRPYPLREIRYTNLPPGEYRFHLQAVDARGTYGEEVASPVIEIRNPFWRETWFFLLVLIAVTAMIYSISVHYSKRKRKIEMETTRTQRLEALGILAGGIAHDFNNYMTIVLGRLSLLEADYVDDAKIREAIEHSTAAIGRARALTQQLLTFAKGGEPVRRVVAINSVIRDSVFLSLSGGNVACRIDLPGDLSLVEVDEGQMSQAINNILINARQAMPDGGKVKIRGRNLAISPPFLPEKRWIEIDFEDEGEGIAQEDQERIFDPYFTTKERASGLGLAIAYSIMLKHGGLITVDSEIGKGSTFRVYLPATEKKIEQKDLDRFEIPGGARRILVMDDDEGVRKTIQRMLDNKGHTSVGTGDGEETVLAYREALERGDRFDAVILDLTVPGGMGGKETVKELLRIDPEAAAIVVSGYANEPVLANYATFGFRACLGKPFTADQLAQVLSEALARQAL